MPGNRLPEVAFLSNARTTSEPGRRVVGASPRRSHQARCSMEDCRSWSRRTTASSPRRRSRVSRNSDPPACGPDSPVAAGNASGIVNGVAALVVTTAERTRAPSPRLPGIGPPAGAPRHGGQARAVLAERSRGRAWSRGQPACQAARERSPGESSSPWLAAERHRRFTVPSDLSLLNSRRTLGLATSRQPHLQQDPQWKMTA